MRELIDKNEIKEVFKRNIAGSEAFEQLFDMQRTFTEQEIVKPCFERLKQVMKERNEDNGGEPLNAIDKGYNLAFEHMCLEIDEILSEQEKEK